jgi:enoyl-CoA hydratase/carnithine racemase
MLLEGKLVKPDRAREIGLVHEVVDANQVLIQAERHMQRYISYQPFTWQQSKINIRRRLRQEMHMDFDVVFAPALKHWWSPETRAIVKAVVDGLRARSGS